MDDNHQNKNDAGFDTQIMRAEKRTERAEVRVEQLRHGRNKPRPG
jgi:hypothetical protein